VEPDRAGSAGTARGAQGPEAPSPLPLLVPTDLLDHLADPEISNPDVWMQGKLQELISGERVRATRAEAMASIAAKLALPPAAAGGAGGDGARAAAAPSKKAGGASGKAGKGAGAKAGGGGKGKVVAAAAE
jgi:hypothetical protein